MNVNNLHEIDEASAETYRLVADRIEASRTEEHLVYRECELDELWRLLQRDRDTTGPDLADRLNRELKVVHEVHDIIAMPKADVRQAAQRLRELADLS